MCSKQRKSKPLNSANMTPSFTGPLPVQCAGRRLFGSLADALPVHCCGGRRPGSFADPPLHCSNVNGILKTFTHTSIPVQPCTLLGKNKNKNKTKNSTHQTCPRLLVLFLSSVVVGDLQEAWQILLRTAPRRRPSRLGQYWQKTFVDVLNKY